MKKPIKNIISSLLFSTILISQYSAYAMDTEELSTENRFKGKVILSVNDPQSSLFDVTGPHHVLYPTDDKDVHAAVLDAHKKDWKTFIRSGNHLRKNDKVDGTGGVVINLRNLSNVEVKKDEVIAQAGATIEEVFKKLSEQNYALPLVENPLVSITSNVLYEGDHPSCLMRSLGPLSRCVSEISGVMPNGELKTFQSENCVEECKTSGLVVTQIKFIPKPAKSLSMCSVNFVYPGKERFLKIVKSLFKDSSRLENTDLLLEAYNGRQGTPLVKICIINNAREDRQDNQFLSMLYKIAFEQGSILGESHYSSDFYSGDQVLNNLMDTKVLVASTDPTVESQKVHSTIPMDEKLDEQLSDYVGAVDRALLQSNNAQHASRLQINRDNQLELTEYIYTPIKANPKRLHVGVSLPLISRAKPLTTLFALTDITESKGPIENFSGPIYKQDDSGYDEKREQYATSSMDKKLMTPLMVAYPTSSDDIRAAILYARKNNLYVAARSGGHQYTGKSSGDNKTIVLSMDNFNTLKQLGNGRVEVGPGIKLTHLAHQFKEWNLTIPHGECPLVAIGGHAQTGGYGHLIRSFGLTLDYVQSFDIVLGDGTLRTVTRPELKDFSTTDPKVLANLDLFRGVLGGNAGSFGVITKYVFNGIKDEDHPRSYGFTKTRRYNGDIFKRLLKEAQKWTQMIEERNEAKIEEVDFMMSVESSTVSTWLPLMLVELVYSDQKKGVPYNGQFDSIINIANEENGLLDPHGKQGENKLSALSDSFVRRFPATTLDGREFKYPYNKRVNVTVKALSDEFVDHFSQKMDEVVWNEAGVKLVFQMAFGGGSFRAKGNEKLNDSTITSIPHRDSVFTFVFDLFYEPGYEERATELQSDMQGIVNKYFHNDSHERRVFWGSFGDTNISDPKIRQMYYDDEEQYKRLQKLKREVDPEDVFHTLLTVQGKETPE